MQYFGVVDVADVMEKLARGEATEYGEAYFMTTPRFETGDARYGWLNRIVAVAESRSGPNWVEYRVHQLVNG